MSERDPSKNRPVLGYATPERNHRIRFLLDISAAVFGVLLILAAPALFCFGATMIHVMENFPVPGTEPIAPSPPSSDFPDYLILSLICVTIGIAGIAAIVWVIRRSRLRQPF